MGDVSVPMDEQERAQAERMARIAALAEEKAAARLKSEIAPKTSASFLSREERERIALENLKKSREERELRRRDEEIAHSRFVTGKAILEKQHEERLRIEREQEERARRQREENKEAKELDFETKSIHDHYLGVNAKKRKVLKPSEKMARVFQFDWEKDDDTSKNDVNPLYSNRVKINALYGRGYIAGVDQRDQRKGSNFLMSLTEKRLAEIRANDALNDNLTEHERQERIKAQDKMAVALQRKYEERDLDGVGHSHWSAKTLEKMTERDWRIFREDFDIRIQGGRATLPLRFWSEANFPEPIMRAIREAGYEQPSPIQRQAIPVGVSRRDIIGIAETGSGKTAAFTIPMLCFLLNLPRERIERCAQEGPLAVVMAPTRELAQHLYDECCKLSKFTDFSACCIVGGQDISQQAFKLRQGVQIVIGTPGRLCDCLEHNLLVLNQCCYVVLDEADRMVDMGFEPQVIEVLDSMGGLLKSEDEAQAEHQIQGEASNIRVTAMFSATMPVEVERIARTYLRHPVVIKIGDEDTGKNKRIEQRVLFISEGQKKNKLMDEIKGLSKSEKAIVFVNSKKQADTIGRALEAAGTYSGVLHGGRSQDQREDTLDQFRKGETQVLVATDVAGRGLDIPDLTHVFNLDCPTKIDNYCHRIGRTGRAGKHGIAITFITDSDTEIMYDLKCYLESTGTPVPAQLQRHPSAQAPIGTRDDRGQIVGQKRDAVKYSSK